MQEQLSTSELTLPILRYDIEHHLHLANPDRRRISGRTLILPQPNFALKSRIQQRFDSTPATAVMSPDHRKQFMRDLGLLAFLSAPLARREGDAYQTQRASSWPDARAHEDGHQGGRRLWG